MLMIPIARSPSTIGRWRKPLSSMIFAASSAVTSGRAVIGSGVIHARTRSSEECVRAATERITSRSVRIPISRPKSDTAAAPRPASTIFWAASPIVSSGATVTKVSCIRSPSVLMRRE